MPFLQALRRHAKGHGLLPRRDYESVRGIVAFCRVGTAMVRTAIAVIGEMPFTWAARLAPTSIPSFSRRNIEMKLKSWRQRSHQNSHAKSRRHADTPASASTPPWNKTGQPRPPFQQNGHL